MASQNGAMEIRYRVKLPTTYAERLRAVAGLPEFFGKASVGQVVNRGSDAAESEPGSALYALWFRDENIWAAVHNALLASTTDDARQPVAASNYTEVPRQA
jgi:hypothetical protein